MNRVEIVGRIGREAPEVRFTPGVGTPVSAFQVAVARPRAKDKTDWIEVVTWRGAAEYAANYGRPGRLIEVSGYLTTNSWEDKEGHKRTKTFITAEDIKYLDKSTGDLPNNSPAPSEEYNNDMTPIDDGDIPF